MAKTRRINIASGFGARTQLPFISLQLGDEFTQMPPAQAREVGAHLLAAAEAAESDAFIMHWAQERLGVTRDQATMLLCEYREFRERAFGQAHEHRPEGEAPPVEEENR
jgi:hypothetical protein